MAHEAYFDRIQQSTYCARRKINYIDIRDGNISMVLKCDSANKFNPHLFKGRFKEKLIITAMNSAIIDKDSLEVSNYTR